MSTGKQRKKTEQSPILKARWQAPLLCQIRPPIARHPCAPCSSGLPPPPPSPCAFMKDDLGITAVFPQVLRPRFRAASQLLIVRNFNSKSFWEASAAGSLCF